MYGTARGNLFVRLARYRPTPARESFEDFLTELIREVLSREPQALEAFLDLSEIAVGDVAAWSVRSQVIAPTCDGRLDLLLERRSGGPALIVESKLAAPVDESQIRRYLDYAGERERTTGQPWCVFR